MQLGILNGRSAVNIFPLPLSLFHLGRGFMLRRKHGDFSFLRRHQRTLIPTGETRTKSPAPIQSTLRDEVQCVLAKAFNLTLTFGRFKATHAWLLFSS